MIELKENDLVKIKEKPEKNRLSVISFISTTVCKKILYSTNDDLWFNDDFSEDDHGFEIIAVWRYDENTKNFVNIYDKDVFERIKNAIPIKGNPTNYYTEPCELAGPADVPYDKYISLEHENAELRNIIVELNKKIYRRDDGE